MKLLFDQNISYSIVKKIIKLFPESKHVSHVSLQNQEDDKIWNYAHRENFTIVTFDADFYKISILKGIPPKII